MLAGEMLKG